MDERSDEIQPTKVEQLATLAARTYRMACEARDAAGRSPRGRDLAILATKAQDVVVWATSIERDDREAREGR